MIKSVFVTCAVMVVLAAPGTGRAQGFLDVYGGASFTESTDLSTRIGRSSVRDPVDFDAYPEIGIRGGLWFPDLPWLGLASDVSYVRLKGPSGGVSHTIGGIPVRTRQDVDVHLFPISLMLMLRTKLMLVPWNSRLGIQPYIGVGPGLFVSWVHNALTVDIGGSEESAEDTSCDLGLDTRAGLRLHLTSSFSLFAEYRFTYYEPDFSDHLLGNSVTFDTNIATHHALAGLGFQF
jgi:Outer membrane protein beta-barrel domain